MKPLARRAAQVACCRALRNMFTAADARRAGAEAGCGAAVVGAMLHHCTDSPAVQVL